MIMFVMTLHKCTFIIFSLIIILSTPLPRLLLPPKLCPSILLSFFGGIEFYQFLSCYFLLLTLTQYDEEIRRHRSGLPRCQGHPALWSLSRLQSGRRVPGRAGGARSGQRASRIPFQSRGEWVIMYSSGVLGTV